MRFTKKSFFSENLSRNQSRLGVSGDFEGFIQLIRGSNKSDKPNNITGVDKYHSKCGCTKVV